MTGSERIQATLYSPRSCVLLTERSSVQVWPTKTGAHATMNGSRNQIGGALVGAPAMPCRQALPLALVLLLALLGMSPPSWAAPADTSPSNAQ